MEAPAEPVLFPLPEATPPPGPLLAKRQVSYHPLPCRSVLNRNPNPQHPFYWTINPYRGCEFGCTYCFARYTHSFMDHEDPLDFEREIYAKVDASEVLASTVNAADLAGRPVTIGAATDPYQPAERKFGITRRILEVLRRYPTLDLSITTKSDLVLRDIDVLVEIARSRPLSIHVSLIAADRALARLLDPGAPTPERRLHAVAMLRRAGLRAGLFIMPILPRITDGEENLDRLFTAAREADSSFVAASLLHLREAPRQRFFPFLAEQFPQHLPWYEQAYRRSATLRGPVRDAIIARVQRFKTRYGFDRAERQGEAKPMPVAEPQLALELGIKGARTPSLAPVSSPPRRRQ